MLGNKKVMGFNIQRHLDKMGITRKDFAKAIGVPYSSLTDWINGKSYPRIDKIELMANYFGIQKSDLVEDSTIVRTNGQDEMYKSGDAKNEIVVSDKDNRFSIHFRDGKTMSDTDKELLKEQIATTIDSFYKLRGIE